MNQSIVKSLSNQDLIDSTERFVIQKREIGEVIIWHLQEIQDRRLFLGMGYESLYECLIKHFMMSDSVAYGRIKVLKILKDVPTASESLKSGELNISNIILAHSFIEKHQKKTGEELSPEGKIELIENIKSKKTAEVKELLARCNPDMALPYDEIRPLTKTHSQMKSTVSKKLVEKINYLKALISHEHINPTHEELLTLAFDSLIEKVEKKKGIHVADKKQTKKDVARSAKVFEKSKTQAELIPTTTSEEITSTDPLHPNPKISTHQITDRNSRYVPRSVKRFILKRSNGRCEHIHADGTRCSSGFQTQYDHYIAFSKGGATTAENMQLLCRVHNAAKGDQ